MSAVSKRRVLLIDDQKSIHDDYRKIIGTDSPETTQLSDAEAELFGDVQDPTDTLDLYDVDSAFSGEDAIQLVEQALKEGRPYAVAFVDIRMPPGLDGVQTVRRLWEIDSEILIVLCSAYSDYSWQDIVRELGRSDRFLFLRKPFDSMEVRQCAAALAVRWMVARTDPLTGLLNRRSFDEHLRREWAHAVRNEFPLSCVMIDVDYFKSVNDRYGHMVGDQALRALSRILVDHAPPGDIVCRYGGEEFCVLLQGADKASAASWAEGVRQSIANEFLIVGSDTVSFTASFGIAERFNGRQEDLVHRADQALRDAKASGRNRVSVWCQSGSQSQELPCVRRYAALFKNLTACDVMTTPVTCLRRDTPVADAANLLLSRQVTSAPVVNDDGSLAGIVAERDVMEALGFNDGWHAPVERFMATRVIQYDPATPASVVFEFLCRVQIHRVVITKDRQPVGLISRGTFLRWVQNYVRALEPTSVQANARPHLILTADALTRRAHHLQDELHTSTDELLEPIVSGISSMQEIMADLLSWARCSQADPSATHNAEIP